jgi:hypothetical protein
MKSKSLMLWVVLVVSSFWVIVKSTDICFERMLLNKSSILGDFQIQELFLFKKKKCSFWVILKSSNCFCACGAQGDPNLQEFEKFDPDPDSFVRGAYRHRLCCVKGREGGKSRRSNARALYVAASMGDIFVFFFFLGFLPSGKFPLVLIFQILFPNSFVSC